MDFKPLEYIGEICILSIATGCTFLMDIGYSICLTKKVHRAGLSQLDEIWTAVNLGHHAEYAD